MVILNKTHPHCNTTIYEHIFDIDQASYTKGSMGVVQYFTALKKLDKSGNKNINNGGVGSVIHNGVDKLYILLNKTPIEIDNCQNKTTAL